MYQEMFANTRAIELAVAQRTIEQRIAVEEFTRIERLQRALNGARARVGWPTAALGRS